MRCRACLALQHRAQGVDHPVGARAAARRVYAHGLVDPQRAPCLSPSPCPLTLALTLTPPSRPRCSRTSASPRPSTCACSAGPNRSPPTARTTSSSSPRSSCCRPPTSSRGLFTEEHERSSSGAHLRLTLAETRVRHARRLGEAATQGGRQGGGTRNTCFACRNLAVRTYLRNGKGGWSSRGKDCGGGHRLGGLPLVRGVEDFEAFDSCTSPSRTGR